MMAKVFSKHSLKEDTDLLDIKLHQNPEEALPVEEFHRKYPSI